MIAAVSYGTQICQIYKDKPSSRRYQGSFQSIPTYLKPFYCIQTND